MSGSLTRSIRKLFLFSWTIHSAIRQYGSGNGPFKIRTFITYLSYNLFEKFFNQNYGT